MAKKVIENKDIELAFKNKEITHIFLLDRIEEIKHLEYVINNCKVDYVVKTAKEMLNIHLYKPTCKLIIDKSSKLYYRNRNHNKYELFAYYDDVLKYNIHNLKIEVEYVILNYNLMLLKS